MQEMKTSSEWIKEYQGYTVLDPDGWDRRNYQYSWFEEEITKEEFSRRLLQSTVTIKHTEDDRK